MLISVTQWSAVICSALDSVIKEDRQPQWGFIHSQALPRKHLSSIFSMKVHHFILYLVVSCLFCIEAFWFIMKHRNIHLYHSLKSGNIQYCESNNAQLCSFNLFSHFQVSACMEPIFGEEEADDPDRFKITSNSVQQICLKLKTTKLKSYFSLKS